MFRAFAGNGMKPMLLPPADVVGRDTATDTVPTTCAENPLKVELSERRVRQGQHDSDHCEEPAPGLHWPWHVRD
jgi:hypothetical protein